MTLKMVQRILCAYHMLLLACQNVVTVPDSLEMDGGTNSATETDIPSKSCAPPGINPLVCQDFENGMTSPVDEYNGQVTLETDRVFAGNASMKATVSGEISYAEIAEQFDPIDSGTIFFRVHLYVPVDNTEGTTKVLNLSSRETTATNEDIGVDINISGQRSIDIFQHGNEKRFKSEDYIIPEGEWFCLKGSYTISETAGATSLWLGDNLATSTTASPDAIINDGISVFRTGIGWIGTGQTSSTVYFDNILVATSQVACSD